MPCFYAQPYDLSATGFYFENIQQYEAGYAACLNDFGQQVEEFQLQFIDGEAIDAQLFEAIGIHQGNIRSFVEKIEEWQDYDKQALIIAVGECGYSFNLAKADPSDFDVDIYEVDSLRELAVQFVEDGLFGDIPENLQFYIDYDAIARDLSVDYSETTIAGRRFIYRCS